MKYLTLRGGQRGASSGGLSNHQINTILRLTVDPRIPVIAADKTDTLKPKPGSKQFAFIINTNPSTSDGSGRDGFAPGHWTAVHFDNRDGRTSAEFYDPLGKPTPPALLNAMKIFAATINPKRKFLLKENRVARQPNGTTTCGHHVIKFLEDRYDGVSWAKATGFEQNENNIQDEVKRYDSYI